MAAYDSDSSCAEDSDYTETNVLLGYASREPADDIVSHLGGRPTWLDPTTPPSAALARCKVCKDLMVLLLQLNGDLPEIFQGHERRLYVLTCRRKTCRRKEGSVRALRAIRVTRAPVKDKRKDHSEARSSTTASARPPTKAVTSRQIGESLFGVKPGANSSSANPFSTSKSGAESSNPFSTSSTSPAKPFSASYITPLSELAAKPAQEPTGPDLPKTFASALSLNNSSPTYRPESPPEPWPTDSELPSPYPLYYLVDADFETLDKVPNEAPLPRQTMSLDDDGNSGAGGSSAQKEDKDTYESTIDKTFQKFADRLAQNPEQVIRYEFRGQPLLYSKSDAVGKLLATVPSSSISSKISVVQGAGGTRIPRCTNCGAPRVFEVQLTPHAITELEAEEVSMEGMEWGTIVVGVCEADCVPRGTEAEVVGFVEEWAGVQWEEEGGKR